MPAVSIEEIHFLSNFSHCRIIAENDILREYQKDIDRQLLLWMHLIVVLVKMVGEPILLITKLFNVHLIENVSSNTNMYRLGYMCEKVNS